ncbi:uncharacterized protein LAESUDRAFT_761436 [Laetiporus sulphureus 93-53]|uniref:peptidylprolyl isomerase n=1 Tax=Laetiporus sulphureus 93-53 TaxID=1314785 RepID=A0A165D3E8_9APHY|nr:uncharacterized protein LAESUDRAFT_761436 [Laetiporus sulphureus 93-53]KZT04082.1 hypothetical protein LAESUDRAFT_761436 [Laetiporus sulphureus 93-53]
MSAQNAISSWGATLRPGCCTFLIPERVNLYITNAALVIGNASTDDGSMHPRTSLWMTFLRKTAVVSPVISSSANSSDRVILFTLVPNQVEHVHLGLTLVVNEHVAFDVLGKSCICLSGNFIAVPSEDNMDATAVPSEDNMDATVKSGQLQTSYRDSSTSHRGRKRARVESLAFTSPDACVESIVGERMEFPTFSAPAPTITALSNSPQRAGRNTVDEMPPLSATARGKRRQVRILSEPTEGTDSDSSAASSLFVPNAAMNSSRQLFFTPKTSRAVSNTGATRSAVLAAVEIKDHQVRSGDLRATQGDEIQLWYRLQLANKAVVQSRMDGTPMEITLGQSFILPAIDNGIVGMKVGGERLIVIPPALGFGDHQHDSIPSNSTLFFQVRIKDRGLDIFKEMDNGSETVTQDYDTIALKRGTSKLASNLIVQDE